MRYAAVKDTSHLHNISHGHDIHNSSTQVLNKNTSTVLYGLKL